MLDQQKLIQASENPAAKVSSDEFFGSLSTILTRNYSVVHFIY